MPPLASMGLVRFADFERGNFDGTTYIEMPFRFLSKANGARTALTQ
jgi:hypothetical protein